MTAVFSMIQLPGREEKKKKKPMYEYWKQNNLCASALLKQNPPLSVAKDLLNFQKGPALSLKH